MLHCKSRSKMKKQYDIISIYLSGYVHNQEILQTIIADKNVVLVQREKNRSMKFNRKLRNRLKYKWRLETRWRRHNTTIKKWTK